MGEFVSLKLAYRQCTYTLGQCTTLAAIVSKMKSGLVALLPVLTLTSCAVAAVDQPRQRLQETELLGTEYDAGYNFGQEVSYDQENNEHGQQQDDPRDQSYGFMEKSIQQEMGRVCSAF